MVADIIKVANQLILKENILDYQGQTNVIRARYDYGRKEQKDSTVLTLEIKE